MEMLTNYVYDKTTELFHSEIKPPTYNETKKALRILIYEL